MASSRLGLWALYYKYFSSVFSALLTLTLINGGFGWWIVLPSLAWLTFSVYTVWPREKLEGASDYKAVIIGAGFSGLDIAKKLHEVGVPFVIIEKSPDLGGTWHDNKYPGAACDVMSHLYSLSDLPNPFWSRGYSGQAEIHQYLKDFADYFDLTRHIQFNKRAKEAKWNDEEQKWEVTTTDGELFVGNFLMSGAGALHVPKIPDFEGKDKYGGKSFHTAQWPQDYDISGKNVGVIGTGASAVQVIPAIADKVKHLTVFQRTPAWSPLRHNYAFPEWLKWTFALFPPLLTAHRYQIYLVNEIFFPVIFNAGSSWAKEKMNKFMLKGYKKVKDPEVKKKLMPNYESGCKRVTPHTSYATTFNKPHVKLVTDKIDCITESGIKTVKEEHKLDAIIYATGFDLIKSLNAYKIVGLGGRDLGEEMGDSPAALNGVVVPNYPNFFFLLGPNTGLGHNTVVFMIECQVTYIMSCVRTLVEAGGKSMNCRRQPLANFLKYIYSEMEKRVWTTSCDSWYKNDKGIVFVLWPNNTIEYWWKLLSCKFTDFKFVYPE